MEDYPGLSPEEQNVIKEVIRAISKPARWPNFPQLGADGQWTQWSANPILPDDGPPSVEQPLWAENPVRGEKRLRCIRTLQHDTLSNGYIRLLRLDTVAFDEHCNLLHGFELISVPLRTAPGYQALSYCWGDLKLCTGIFFTDATNQRIFRVTEDLAICLYSVIKSKNLKTPTYIWIDQICINQKNTTERNFQVQIMAEIYRRASQVIVWLGQEAEPGSWLRPLAGLNVTSSPAHDGIKTFTDHVTEISLFTRSWFTRVWVFQEAVLAKAITVLIGQRTLSFNKVCISLAGSFRWSHCHWSHHFMASMLHTNLVVAIRRAWNSFHETGCIDLLQTMDIFGCYLDCKNPRDRVYALMGCTPDLFPCDFVDYRKSVGEVYRDATRIVIAHYKKLDIISRATMYRQELQASHEIVPTWASAWGVNRNRRLRVPLKARGFQASGGRLHQPTLGNDPNRLQVRGKITAIIKTVIPGTPWLAEEEQHLISGPRWISMRELCSAVQLHATDIESKVLSSNLGRNVVFEITRDVVNTVCCRDTPVNAPGEGNDHDRAEKTHDSIIADQLDESASSKVTYHQVNALGVNYKNRLERCIAILSNGRLALVLDGRVKAGDSIAILHGLSVPCVLRKVEGTDEYTFHGDAFIKGMMQGEVVDWDEEEADILMLI